MLLPQLLLVVVATLLDFGPFGRQASYFLSLTSGLILVWALTWFGQQREAFRFAIMIGVVYGLIGFFSPIVWLAVFVGAYLLTDWLKGRFFDASSVLLALVTLGLVSIWEAGVLGIAARSFELLTVVGGLIANVVAGAILYYFVGIRFKFLQRWAGRRL